MAARSRWRQAVVAAVVIATVAAAAAHPRSAELIRRLRVKVAVERLLDELPPEHLPTARFSAIPGARLRASARGTNRADISVDARAGAVLTVSLDATFPEGVAATAAALAVKRQAAKAIPLLEKAVARTPGDAPLWNDLAAAHYEANHPLRALVAADQALRLAPRFAPALHNRALILDRLGLSPEAAEAWRRCLAEAEQEASLAVAVRERLKAAEMPSELERWQTAEKELFAAVAAGDGDTVERIVAQFPERSRRSAEAIYIASWARAADRDPAEAGQWLRRARMAGAALRRRNETLLAESVEAIDSAIAQNDSARLGLLVRAHIAYDSGRRAYSRRRYEDAERELRQAAEWFQAAGSPMAPVARTWTASVLIDVSRNEEARRILAAVVAAEQSRPGHRALLAHGEYLLALCEAFGARWHEATVHTQHSASLFRQLGEVANAATSENMLASILDLLGQREEGWEVRLRAFEGTSASGALDRLLVTVGTGMRAAARAGDRELALSLSDVELSLAARVRNPLLTADLLTRRVLLQHQRQAHEDRNTSLERARNAIASVENADESARLTMELDCAEAVITREANPKRAVELLDRAVGFCRRAERQFLLPTFLLQRARAHLAANQPELAWQDFSSALDELEEQRGALPDLWLRSRMLDTAEELFDEATALQVRRGEAEEAFRVIERSRGRALLDALGGPQPVSSPAAVAGRLAPGTLLIEYAVLPDRLVIFTIRNDGVRMHTVDVARDRLADHPNPAAILLEPIRQEIATASRLIIVPDDVLQRTAFSALPWNGRFLVQTHILSVAPSASRLVAAREESEARRKSILIVGNPAPDPEQELDPLPLVRREIAAIGQLHPQARVLFGDDATKSRFMAEAPLYDVIHFAGHGLSDEESLTAALLFRGEKGGSARMDANEIARLRLPRSPLVILAACGTLRGRVAGVEGMPSLARSFLAAGASAVVGTLTDIDDARAADLLRAFHRHLAAGTRPEEALRNAQLEAIARGGDAADPKHWAQFVLYSATP